MSQVNTAAQPVQLPPQLIRQFNNAWTSVMASRDRFGQPTGGWEFRCECNHTRRFTPQYFTDPYSAAVRARDTHRCA